MNHLSLLATLRFETFIDFMKGMNPVKSSMKSIRNWRSVKIPRKNTTNSLANLDSEIRGSRTGFDHIQPSTKPSFFLCFPVPVIPVASYEDKSPARKAVHCGHAHGLQRNVAGAGLASRWSGRANGNQKCSKHGEIPQNTSGVR